MAGGRGSRDFKNERAFRVELDEDCSPVEEVPGKGLRVARGLIGSLIWDADQVMPLSVPLQPNFHPPASTHLGQVAIVQLSNLCECL